MIRREKSERAGFAARFAGATGGKPVTCQGSVQHARLSDDEAQELRAGYNHVAYPDDPESSMEAFLMASLAWITVAAPQWLLTAVRNWRSNPRRPGVFVIENFPIDHHLPPTPTDGRRSPHKLSNMAEAGLAGICGMLGEPFAFQGERHGELVQDLTPIRGREQSLTNEGTVRLGWHNEHSSTGQVLSTPVPVVVSFLGFIGLRPDPAGRAKTLVADIRDALPLMSAAEVEALRAAEFRMRPPLLVRETLPPEAREVGPLPVLSGPEEAPLSTVSLYGDLVEPVTPRAARALDALQAALDQVQRGVSTQPGCMYLVDNRYVLHARAPYQARFDGTDRWLLRLMVTDSLFPLRGWQRNAARILEP